MPMRKPTEELVRSAQHGNKEALRELVERFQPLVWAAARRLAPAPEDAEDLAQEANLALLSAIANFRPAGGAPFAWYAKRQVYWGVLAAARRLTKERARAGVSLEEVRGEELSLGDLARDLSPGPEEIVLAEGERAALRSAWQELTPRQRQVLAARACGLTFGEVAAAMGVAPSTVKGLAARGLARLQKLLGDRV